MQSQTQAEEAEGRNAATGALCAARRTCETKCSAFQPLIFQMALPREFTPASLRGFFCRRWCPSARSLSAGSPRRAFVALGADERALSNSRRLRFDGGALHFTPRERFWSREQRSARQLARISLFCFLFFTPLPSPREGGAVSFSRGSRRQNLR